MEKNKLTAHERLQLVIESLKGDVKTSELCRRHDIWPTELNRFRKVALEGALKALNSRKGKKDHEKEALKSKIERLKEIITSQASEIDLFEKKNQLGLLGPIKGKKLSVMTKYQLIDSIDKSRLSSHKACRILGLNPDRFYRWKSLYTNLGLNNLSDRPPLAENIGNRLLPEEESAIFEYANTYPQQHHRGEKVSPVRN